LLEFGIFALGMDESELLLPDDGGIELLLCGR
jgi:hypothetical protein